MLCLGNFVPYVPRLLMSESREAEQQIHRPPLIVRRSDWRSISDFNAFSGVLEFINDPGRRFEIKKGSILRPEFTISWKCTLFQGKHCKYLVKSIYVPGPPEKWEVKESGSHTHDGLVPAKGMTGVQRALVDRLVAENPMMSARGITDLTVHHDRPIDGTKVQQRMTYLRNGTRRNTEPDEFDGSLDSFKNLLAKFVSSCKILREEDKPIVKVLGTVDAGRYDILITTDRLLGLLKDAGQKCVYVDGTFDIFKPLNHKVLTASVISGDNKYYTTAYVICLQEDKIGHRSLADGVKALIRERYAVEFVPDNVCADGLAYIGEIWSGSTRLMCAQHVERSLMKRLSGKEEKGRFHAHFQALRRCPNSVVLDKAVKDVELKFPSLVSPLKRYIDGGELGRWCKAQVPALSAGTSLVNNLSETGNKVLKGLLNQARVSSDFRTRLEYIISVIVPEQSSRLVNEKARVCSFFCEMSALDSNHSTYDPDGYMGRFS